MVCETKLRELEQMYDANQEEQHQMASTVTLASITAVRTLRQSIQVESKPRGSLVFYTHLICTRSLMKELRITFTCGSQESKQNIYVGVLDQRSY